MIIHTLLLIVQLFSQLLQIRVYDHAVRGDLHPVKIHRGIQTDPIDMSRRLTRFLPGEVGSLMPETPLGASQIRSSSFVVPSSLAVG